MRPIPRLLVPLGLAACLLTFAPYVALASFGSATVYWTASGGDSLTGQASAYDLRYSLTPITTSNFALATRAAGVPAPRSAGSAERFQVSGLQVGSGYYFAIKSVDEASNWSGLSNVVFFSVRTTSVAAPEDDRLSPPWPNPARASTSWSFALAATGPIEIDVFDLAGRRVRSIVHELHTVGPGEVTWNLRDDEGHPIVPGVYLIRALVGRHTSVQKLAIVR